MHLSIRKVEVFEATREGKHLVIACSFAVNDKELCTYALIDCGDRGVTFVDQDFAHHHQKPAPHL